MGGNYSAQRTDKNLLPLDYFEYSKKDIDECVKMLNYGSYCSGCPSQDAKKAHEFIEMVKGVLRKDRYRLMELMTTRASFSSVGLQMKNVRDGKRGAKIKNTDGVETNWILEYCLEKGGVWPKVFQKLSLDDRFIKDTEAREELVMLQSKMPKASSIGIATAISLQEPTFHQQGTTKEVCF